MAMQIGEIIKDIDPKDLRQADAIQDLMRRYAEALEPWAMRTARAMIEDVNGRDLAQWRSLTSELSKGIRDEIMAAPVGDVMRELLSLQVTLIKSIPLDAAKRVHELTQKAAIEGTRASEIAAEIMRSGEVAKSSAMCIARTEVARTKANLQQARALAIGSEGYVWETSKDGDVRKSHKEMSGKFVRWDSPPTLDGMVGHAGCLPNCRCWSRIVLPF